MKKEKLGFALLLFGSILAVPDPVLWWSGLVLGLTGLFLVILAILGDKK